MNIFNWVTQFFGGECAGSNTMGFDINPANGLPMVGAVDIKGNPYGTDRSDDDDDDDSASSSFESCDDLFSDFGIEDSCSSSFDD